MFSFIYFTVNYVNYVIVLIILFSHNLGAPKKTLFLCKKIK